MKTVACIIQDGFAPFEFGVACEAFGLDRSSDGVPNFDFRIVAPRAGVVQSKIGFSVNVEHDLAFAYEADLVVFCPLPRERWGDIDPLLLDVARHAVDRGAWVMSVCSGSFILAAAGVLDGRRATTHWMYAHVMADMYPQIDIDPTCSSCRTGRSSPAPAPPPGSTPACTCSGRRWVPSSRTASRAAWWSGRSVTAARRSSSTVRSPWSPPTRSPRSPTGPSSTSATTSVSISSRPGH